MKNSVMCIKQGLATNITPGKAYPLEDKFCGMVKIIDNRGKKVWMDENLFRKN